MHLIICESCVSCTSLLENISTYRGAIAVKTPSAFYIMPIIPYLRSPKRSMVQHVLSYLETGLKETKPR